MDFPKITIAGDLGSGKSTIGKLIAQKSGYKFFSTGDIQRKIASQHGMTTLEFNSFMKSNPEIDHKIDNFTKGLSKKKESFVLDSRMAWYFIPNSFKVYLKVQPGVAAQRIFNDQKRFNEEYYDIIATKNDILKRKRIENARFMALYKTDCSNINHYDLVIDTSHTSPKSAADIILTQLDYWKKEKPVNKLWMNPKVLIPTQDVISLGRSDTEEIYSGVERDGYDYRKPVTVVSILESFYIYDGHKRASAAILSNLDIIPVLKIAGDNDEIIKGLSVRDFIKTESQKKFVHSWESVHKYSFEDYVTFDQF